MAAIVIVIAMVLALVVLVDLTVIAAVVNMLPPDKTGGLVT